MASIRRCRSILFTIPTALSCPGPQAELEADYKRELKEHFGIVFNQLYTITNLPIARFASYLKNNNKLAEYMALLNDAFNPGTGEWPDVPQHDQRELDGRSLRLRLQSDAEDAMVPRGGNGANRACIFGTSIRPKSRTAKS